MLSTNRCSISHNFVFLLILALYTLPRACGQDASSRQWETVVGTWTFKSIYPTDNVEDPSRSQQKKLLGTDLIISPGTLKSCGQSISIGSVQANQVSPDDFLFNTRVRFKQVGIITSNITEIVFNNKEAGACFNDFPLPGQDIYVKSKNEILVDFEGVFYRVIRKQSVQTNGKQ